MSSEVDCIIQQQMETDVETHSQTLGRAQEVMWKIDVIELSRQEGSRIPQEDLQRQLSWTYVGSQRLNH